MVHTVTLFEDHLSLYGTGRLVQIKLQYDSPQIASFAYRRISEGMASGARFTDISPESMRNARDRALRTDSIL